MLLCVPLWQFFLLAVHLHFLCIIIIIIIIIAIVVIFDGLKLAIYFQLTMSTDHSFLSWVQIWKYTFHHAGNAFVVYDYE